MRKTLLSVVGVTAIWGSYTGYHSVTVQRFLAEGADGVWKHLSVEDMKKSNN